jgi:hypothetical protein
VVRHLRNTLGRLSTGPRLAGVLVLAIGAVGTYEYARILNDVYPLRLWLFWKLAMLWGWVALFNVACMSFGQLLLVRALKLRHLPALESALFALALGVISFVLVMYVGGAFGWFTAPFAVALPVVLLLVGATQGARLGRSLISDARRCVQHSPLNFAITAAGILCVGIIYLGAMTPDALNYDSTWCHLTVAQDYARAGRIVAFPGDYTKNVPQLASLIHTWGWLLPGLDPPLRWMLVLHNEFALFLWTLAGVAAGVRRLVHDPQLRGAWAAFFLFPIIFVYDNNLGGAADHICAFFSVPIMLATLHVCASFSPGSSALLGIVSGGAVLTKYQALYVMVPVALVVGTVWLWRLGEHGCRSTVGTVPRVPLRRLLWSPLLIAGFGVLCVSPHFIRQAIFHHNPVYPFAQDVFTASTPTLPNAPFLVSNILTDRTWRPTGTLWDRFLHAAKLFVTFSFVPHYSFNNNVPVFGSLFTLLLPALVVVRGRSRLLVAVIIASGALLVWGMVYNVDRNLQIFMPVLVCVVAALIVKIWRLGAIARLGLIPLVGLQIVWGADALFYSSHERIHSAMDLIRSGFEGRAETRLSSYRSDYVAIGRALPPAARLLIHTSHISLGIDREVVLDWAGYQSFISYDRVHTPRQLFDYYRSLGITHFLSMTGSRPAASKQEEVLWHAFVSRYALNVGRFGGYRLQRMPDRAPPVENSYRVAVFGLRGYADGIYPIGAMTTNEYLPDELRRFPAPETPMPKEPAAQAALLTHVDAVFIGPRASERTISDLMGRRFASALQLSSQFALYLKSPGAA